jgi:hypothetical protein
MRKVTAPAPALPSAFPYPYLYRDPGPVGYESLGCVMVPTAPTSAHPNAYYYACPYAQQPSIYPQCPVMMVYVPQEAPTRAVRPPPPPEKAFEKMKTKPEPKVRVQPPPGLPPQKPNKRKVLFPGPAAIAPPYADILGSTAYLGQDSINRS